MSFLEQQHLACVDLAHVDGALAQQRTARRGHEAELVLEQLTHIQFAGVIRQRDQRYIEVA